MSSVTVKMNETGEIRKVPHYVAEHIVATKKGTLVKTEDYELIDAPIVETAMEQPGADPQVETAVTPAENPKARKPSRRKQS